MDNPPGDVKNKTDRAVLAMLVVALLGNITLAALLHRARHPQPSNNQRVDRPRLSPADVGELTSGSPPSQGPTDPAVTIVMFSDFQCPYCKHFAATLKDVDSKQAKHFRLIFRQFPLSFHSHARGYAELSACAAKQSTPAFWAVYDYFFAVADQTKDVTNDAIYVLVNRPDINGVNLRTCIEKHQAAGDVDRDLKLGEKYAVTATPTSFVNGVPIVGALDADGIRQLINKDTSHAASVLTGKQGVSHQSHALSSGT